MWQDSGYKSPIGQKKKKKRSDRPQHLKRTCAQIKLSLPLGAKAPGGAPEIATVRLVLNDFTAKRIDIFTQNALRFGQELAFTLDEPKRFYSRARVIRCAETPQTGKIISLEKFKYRITLEFIFDSPEQEESVRQFSMDILREFVVGGAPISEPAPKAA